MAPSTLALSPFTMSPAAGVSDEYWSDLPPEWLGEPVVVELVHAKA